MKLFSECGRIIPGVVKGSKIMQFYVDNTPEKCAGLCFYFVRFKNDNAINEKTIHEVFSLYFKN